MSTPKNPKPVGMPLTLSAEKIMANQQIAHTVHQRKRGVTTSALHPAETNPFAAAAQAQKQSRAEREAAALLASYSVGSTEPSKVDLRRGDLPGWTMLEVDAIDEYEHNPRQFRNDKRAEIKAGMEANGFTGALTVTRRREGDRYILAAGGNTTLNVLKELWASTGDERYRWVKCIFQTHEGDTKLLAQHLGENLNRGDMKFWEIATGMMDLVAMIHADRQRADPAAKPMSQREMTEELRARGLKADKTSVGRWQFAVERLRALGATTALLTPRSCIVLQPRLIAVRGLSAKFDIAEEVFWAEVVDPVLQRAARSVDPQTDGDLDAELLCNEVEIALAERAGETVQSLRQMLSILRVSPELTLADLRVPSIARPGDGASAGDGGHRSAEPPVDPLPAAAQRQLPLNPGAVRVDGRAPGSNSATGSSGLTPGAQPPSAPTGTADAPRPQAPLFEDPVEAPRPSAAGTPAELKEAVLAVLNAVGLADTYRDRPGMPLGFFLELPDPAIHPRLQVRLDSEAYQRRMAKTVVWWHLVCMSGQLGDGCTKYIDLESAYFAHFGNDHDSDPFASIDIEHDPLEVLPTALQRLAPGPLQQAMRLLRFAEEQAAQFLQRHPERWRRMQEIHPDIAI
ncbi:MAG: hypothetical protein QM750_19630 [Rubrivivax sp.]